MFPRVLGIPWTAEFRGWFNRRFGSGVHQHVKIYVGNLSFKARDNDLRAAFEAYGVVSSAEVVMERDSDRSRGFGFVEMPNAAEGQAAIAALDGKEICGRPIRANESQPRPR